MKKTTPRGYSEFLDFVENMSSGKIWDEIQDKPSELIIEDFLNDCYKKRFAVTRCLLDAMLENQDNDLKSSTIAMILSRMNPQKVSSDIIAFIQKSEVNDRVRKKLLLVLEKYNLSNEIPALIPYFQNKETLTDYIINNLSKKINTNGANFNTFFEYLKEQDIKFFELLIANLIKRSDEKSIWILGLLAEHPNLKVAEKAIQALGTTKSEIALEILENLIVHPNQTPYQNHSIQLLLGYGISRINHRMSTPHKCYLSWIDGTGNQILLVSRRTGRGRLCMVSFILNEKDGIHDCTIWNNISSFEMERMVNGLEIQMGLKQIDYLLGIRFIEHALWKIVSQKRLMLPNFLLARRIFGAQKLVAQKYNIQETQLGLQYILPHKDELISQSIQLLQERPFQDWWIDTEDTRLFITSHPTLKNGSKIRKDIITQFVKTFIVEYRSLWQERFLMTAEFLHKTSPRISRKAIEICLALYIVLRNNEDIINNPFFLQFAEYNIQKLLSN